MGTVIKLHEFDSNFNFTNHYQLYKLRNNN